MKVIYVGYSKTGTKTMAAVFREFGYKTYDWLENEYYLGNDWRRIIHYGGTVEDLRRMYKGVDAVVDAPAYLFWKEMSEAFPEAKLIICIRDETLWAYSMKKQMTSIVSDPMYVLMQTLSYSGWQHFLFNKAWGISRKWPWSSFCFNEMLWKRNYRNHNCSVLQEAPKEKLLVYNFGDGWKPICEFLGEKIPDTPFPHLNVAASLLDESRQHPTMVRMWRETMFSLGVLTLLGVYCGYKVYQNPTRMRCYVNTIINCLFI
ncbi:uncharacterized protein LOC108951032 [Ciona intestinalis]